MGFKEEMQGPLSRKKIHARETKISPANWGKQSQIASNRYVWRVQTLILDSNMSKKMSWESLVWRIWCYVRWLPMFWPLAFVIWCFNTVSRIIHLIFNFYRKTKSEFYKSEAMDSLPTKDVLPPFIIIAFLFLQVSSKCPCIEYTAKSRYISL